jgi:hypothetical protein
LRDDSDFSRPFWAQGVEHVADHLATDDGKRMVRSHGFTALAEWWVSVQVKLIRTKIADWLLVVVLGALGLTLLWMVARSGALLKVLGG